MSETTFARSRTSAPLQRRARAFLFALTAAVLVPTVSVAAPSRADLVGHWARPGLCTSQRFEFSPDGKFRRVHRRDVSWEPVYQGVFHVVDPPQRQALGLREPMGVILTEGDNMDGNLRAISGISRETLTGRWTESSEELVLVDDRRHRKVSWIRCQ